MKKLILLLIALYTSFSVCNYAIDITPRKGDNTIQINADKTNLKNYIDFCTYLISKGFSLDSCNFNFRSAITKPVIINDQIQ